MAFNKVKITNDVELKDRLVAINRVTKVTKGGRTFSSLQLLLVETKMVSSVGVLVRQVK